MAPSFCQNYYFAIPLSFNSTLWPRRVGEICSPQNREDSKLKQLILNLITTSLFSRFVILILFELIKGLIVQLSKLDGDLTDFAYLFVQFLGRMEGTQAGKVMAIFLMVAQISQVFSLPTTAPAFLWTPHDYGYLSYLICNLLYFELDLFVIGFSLRCLFLIRINSLSQFEI